MTNHDPWMEAMFEGDFERAWQQTDRVEMPRRLAEAQGKSAAGERHLRWNGASFKGKRVLVTCEHGLGDSIQFSRFFPWLGEEAGHVSVKVQPALLELFEGMPGIDLLLNAWTEEPDPEHDVSIECMELAYAFRCGLQTLPEPCLPLDRIRQLALGLEPRGPLNVGIVWAASWWDPRRSIPLEQLAPLDLGAAVCFYGLQQGNEAAERAPFALEPLSHLTQRIPMAARAMLAMDLVITVDGMPAHLAGSLGCPTWMLLPFNADWRWMRNTTESPWYPSMRIFRQSAPGDWSAPVLEVARLLRERSARWSSV